MQLFFNESYYFHFTLSIVFNTLSTAGLFSLVRQLIQRSVIKGVSKYLTPSILCLANPTGSSAIPKPLDTKPNILEPKSD